MTDIVFNTPHYLVFHGNLDVTGMRKISHSSVRFLILAIFFTALTVSCSTAVDLSYSEERAHKLNETVMCPVCPGESIDQSQNPLALQMRELVKDKLDQGWSDQQIQDYFVERYGPSVLLAPPRSGVGLVIWIVPPVIVIFAILILIMVIKSMTKNKIINDSLKQVNPSQEKVSEYSKRLEKIIDEP
ncbi:MAG: cytochrome c-type biogenesis protein CcmH [Chloroflexota bacterium]